MESFIEKVRIAGVKIWHVKKAPASPICINKSILEEIQEICRQEKIVPRYLLEEITETFIQQYRRFKNENV